MAVAMEATEDFIVIISEKRAKIGMNESGKIDALRVLKESE